MPGAIRTLRDEIYSAVTGHDWSGDIAETVNVDKNWSPTLKHKELNDDEPRISVVPGDLAAKRGDAAGFTWTPTISVAVRAKASTEARADELVDFAEAVLEFLSEQSYTWPLVELSTAPLIHSEILETHNVWFSLLVLRFGPE